MWLFQPRPHVILTGRVQAHKNPAPGSEPSSLQPWEDPWEAWLSEKGEGFPRVRTAATPYLPHPRVQRLGRKIRNLTGASSRNM